MIGGDKYKVFDLGLCNQKTIKRVSMQIGKIRNLAGVVMLHRKWCYAVAYQP